MNGVIIVDKPKNCTSHDIVNIVKRIVNTKVGHTGTLDPNATGVLPILIGEGTKKEKYRKNIDAIKVLKKCEEEKRYATKEEQEILAQYIGWGGISEVFDSNNEEWEKEYKELFSILTEIEYKEAKESTLTSFYTPPIVIDAIYKALNKMGFNKGNILEPSCRSW